MLRLALTTDIVALTVVLGTHASPVDDCIKLHNNTLSRVDEIHNKLNNLLNKLEECEKKNVDLSSEKHDIRLSLKYLEEAKEVLSRDRSNLE
ncbi:TPA: hypothetical protein HA336_04880 [Methanopyrus kandleri]|uniref:Uncharacterized protein n=1 Tax=Methanopyrus kandleri TaxID=2320 RepID=A0A832WAX2_9EURY|nr:hypothetical protein [Methanopyrus kandleri]HII70548.1 hypothetical protein [Methanopyrus kandleri]